MCNPDIMPQNDDLNGHWLSKPVPDSGQPFVNVYDYFKNDILPASITYAAFQTQNGNYVTADYAGGGPVHVNAPWVRSWERLCVIDRNGGTLQSGDQINILTSGGFFLMAIDGGGEGVEATATHSLDWETFKVWKQNGTGTIGNGDLVAIQAQTEQYFVAEGGGGGTNVLNANRDVVGSWERFVLFDLANCTCAITPAQQTVNSNAATVNATVTSSQPCEWSARSLSSFLSTSSAGTGNGTMTVDVAPNGGDGRVGSVMALSWSGGSAMTIIQTATPPPQNLGAPTNLSASPLSATSVLVTWQPGLNATTHELWRASGGGAYVIVSLNASSPYVDTNVPTGSTSLYKVRGSNGTSVSSFSNVDFATTVVFTDDPLSPGLLIRAAYLQQIRAATNAMRAAAGLAAATFTDDPVVANQTPIRAVYIAEARTLLSQALTAMGFPAPAFTDPTLIANQTLIRAHYFQELRDAVK